MDGQIALAAFIAAAAYVVALTLRHVVARFTVALLTGAALGPWGLGLVEVASQPLWRPTLLVAATPLFVAVGAALRQTRPQPVVLSITAAGVCLLTLLGVAAGVPVVTAALVVPAMVAMAPRETDAPSTLESSLRWGSAAALALGGLAVSVMHAHRWLAATRVTAEAFVLPGVLVVLLAAIGAVLHRRGGSNRLRAGSTPLMLLVLLIAALADLLGAAGVIAAVLAGWWLAGQVQGVQASLEPLLELCAMVAVVVLGAVMAGAGTVTLVAAAALGLVFRAVSVVGWSVWAAQASLTDRLRGLTGPPSAAVALVAIGVASLAPVAPRAVAAAAVAVASAMLVPEAVLSLALRSRPVLQVQVASVDRIGDRAAASVRRIG